MHLVGVVESQLRRDRPAGGVAGDVSAAHAQLLEQGRSIGGVVPMLTGGGVCVLPTQPRLWYRISW